MRSRKNLGLILAAACACATPALGQVFTVTNNADNGLGTLRSAITQADPYNGAATINFNSGLGMIALNSALPSLTNSNGITINGNGAAVSGPAGADATFIASMTGPPTISGATAGMTAFTTAAGNLTALAGTTVSGGNAGNDQLGVIALGATDNLLGGTGVAFQSGGTLTNGGSIAGGSGGASPEAGSGGTGGAGVLASTANATVNNTGFVAGGGAGTGEFGGTGGTGMQFTAFGFAINSGTVSGGNGGRASIGAGGGGTAISFSTGGSLNNAGTIIGGAGTVGETNLPSSNGGNAVSISGAGSVTNSGTITGGTGGSAGFESVAGSAGAAIVITGGVGTLTNQNHGAINGNVTLDNYANNVTLQIGSTINGSLNVGTSSSSTLTLTDDGSAGIGTYSTAVTSTQFSGQLIKAGGGTWIMNQSLNFVGGSLLNAGTLSVSADANLGNSAGTLGFNGGTLQITGTTFNSTPRTINWGASGGGFDINNASNTFTLSQTLSNGGTLTKRGAGTLVLGGAADNASLGAVVDAGNLILAKSSNSSVHAIGGGGLAINGGSVQLASNSGGDQIYDGAPVTLTSGTFDLNGDNETIGTLSGSGGTITNSNNGSTGSLTVSGGSFSATMGTSGNGIALVMNGSGNTLTLAGGSDNGYLGLTVNAGTVVLDKSSNGGTHAVGGGLTLNSGVVQLAGTGGDQIYDGNTVTLNGGTFDMNGNSETIGALNGSGATITNTASGSLSTLTVSGGGTFGGSIINGAGTLALVKSGNNTLTIKAATANFSGGATLTAGTLSIAQGSTLSANLNQTGGTFAGTGSLNGSLTLTAGNLEPGSGSGGALSTGSASLTGGQFIIDITGPSAGSYSTLSASSVNLSSTGLGFHLQSVLGQGDSLQIITSTLPITGTFPNIPNGAIISLGAFDGMNYSGQIHYDSTDVTINDFTSAVPEPVATAFLVLPLAALGRRRRRR